MDKKMLLNITIFIELYIIASGYGVYQCELFNSC